MDLIQFDIEISFYEGDIEAPAVVSDQNLEPLNVLFEIVEILTLNIGKNEFSVIQSDRRYFIAPGIKSCCFNVQIGNKFSELREDPPELIRWQPLSKIIWVLYG